MSLVAEQEKRRHRRFDGEQYPLRIGSHAGRLVDWSAGGIAVRIRDGVESYRAGDPIDIRITCSETMAVAVFSGIVQRTDPDASLLGVRFAEDGVQAEFLLAELTGRPDQEP